MPKTHLGDLGMPIAERKEAMALLATIRGENQVEAKVATQRLLETASFFTWLVEVAWLTRQDLIREACKDYRSFPLLIASSKGRDTKQKLNRADFLPIGENHPFKRLSGKARNDNLRHWIESSYDSFRLIQLGEAHLVDPIDTKQAEYIVGLPELTQLSARKWAVAFARKGLVGAGGASFARAFGFDLSKETEKRRRRKLATFRKRFDEAKLLRGDPQKWSLVKGEKGRCGGFFIQDTLGNRGRELDFAEATEFKRDLELIAKTAPTEADKLNTLADIIEQRLLSILK